MPSYSPQCFACGTEYAIGSFLDHWMNDCLENASSIASQMAAQSSTVCSRCGLDYKGWAHACDGVTATTDPFPLDKGDVTVAESSTGGQKETNDIRFGLIPQDALWEVARVYGLGAKKYTDDNWRRGYDWHLSYDAMQRHAARFWNGESIDEAGFHHLAAVVFHALALMTFEKEHPELDDRFKAGR